MAWLGRGPKVTSVGLFDTSTACPILERRPGGVASGPSRGVPMSLAKEIGSHHTMWFTVGDHRPVAVRYAVDNDEGVCFGHHGLQDLIEGSTITGTVHDIACGQPLLATSFDVRVLVRADVALGT